MDIQRYESVVDDFLYMQWLRPENIMWDVAAAELISPHLRQSKKIVDIGVGNGYTTFLYLGGKFRKEYDWYFNTDVSGFWDNADIYDAKSEFDIQNFVAEPAQNRLAMCVDHKKNLVDQARELDLADKYLVADANEPIAFEDIDLVFSNMFYWLRDPASVVRNVFDNLKPGGELVCVCPNTTYYNYCRSYQRDTKMWTMLNRGRADSILWSMDTEQFIDEIADPTGFEVKSATRYCCEQTLRIWDVGLRPLSPYLIKMANKLKADDRFEIKQEWCEGIKPILFELLEEELDSGAKEGGYNFFHLRKPA